LQLADRWEMTKIKQIALENLLKADLDPVERIMLCEREDLSRDLATEAYVSVCTRESPLTVEELKLMSNEVASIVMTCRERIIALRGNTESSTMEIVKGAIKLV
jgi:hypothetical protein